MHTYTTHADAAETIDRCRYIARTMPYAQHNVSELVDPAAHVLF